MLYNDAKQLNQLHHMRLDKTILKVATLRKKSFVNNYESLR